MNETTEKQALSLLQQIIAIPSMSGDEELLSRFLENWLRERDFIVNKKNNNIWVESIIDESLPKILLNSHMDTIKVVAGWTLDPYLA